MGPTSSLDQEPGKNELWPQLLAKKLHSAMHQTHVSSRRKKLVWGPSPSGAAESCWLSPTLPLPRPA